MCGFVGLSVPFCNDIFVCGVDVCLCICVCFCVWCGFMFVVV